MSSQLITDGDLGYFADVLGIFVFVLIAFYHYVSANPKLGA